MNKKTEQESTSPLFIEPKLPSLDLLVNSEEVFPEAVSLDLEDLPKLDAESANFQAMCASTHLVNSFLENYEVNFVDRMNLVKSILTLLHGTAVEVANSKDVEAQQKYLAEGGREYYGQYL